MLFTIIVCTTTLHSNDYSIIDHKLTNFVIYQDAIQYSVKFAKNCNVKQFKNSTRKILILSRIEKIVWVVLLCVTRLDFLKSHFKGPKNTI